MSDNFSAKKNQYVIPSLLNACSGFIIENIYKPKDANENTPVIVFFHGGSLMSGSTAFTDYNGIEYSSAAGARINKIDVTTPNVKLNSSFVLNSLIVVIL